MNESTRTPVNGREHTSPPSITCQRCGTCEVHFLCSLCRSGFCQRHGFEEQGSLPYILARLAQPFACRKCRQALIRADAQVAACKRCGGVSTEVCEVCGRGYCESHAGRTVVLSSEMVLGQRVALVCSDCVYPDHTPWFAKDILVLLSVGAGIFFGLVVLLFLMARAWSW